MHQNVLSAHVEDNGAGGILPKVGDLKVSLSPLGGKGHRALDCCVVQALVKPMLCLGKVDKLFLVRAAPHHDRTPQTKPTAERFHSRLGSKQVKQQGDV